MSSLSQFQQNRMIFYGAYSAGTAYRENNIVTYNNNVYICLRDSTGNLPTNTTYWATLTTVPTVAVATVGSGPTPLSYYLSSNGSTITLNKPS